MRRQRALVVAGERLFMNLTGALRHGTSRKIARAVLSFLEPAMGRALAAIWDDPRLAPTADKISFRTLRQHAPMLLPIAARFLGTLLNPNAGRRRAQAVGRGSYRGLTAPRRTAAHAGRTPGSARRISLHRTERLVGHLLPGFAPGMAALNLSSN